MSGHDHGHGTTEGRMWIVFGLTSIFMVAEIIAGIVFRSLALLPNAAHMFTDVMAIAIAAMRCASRACPPTASGPFGYHRFEILAAAFNA